MADMSRTDREEFLKRLKFPVVVNLFAGPGAGKSTVAAGVFEELKWIFGEQPELKANVELVREFAKDEVWARNWKSFTNQFYLSGLQTHRQHVLCGEVDVIVTDSPIILGAIYGASLALSKALVQEFHLYHNINFNLLRFKPYDPKGRRESEESARSVDRKATAFLKQAGIPYEDLRADRQAKHVIVKRVLEEIQKRRAV